MTLRSRQDVVDPATVYAVQADDEQSVAHRVGAEDATTSVSLSDALLADLIGDRVPPIGVLRTAGRFDLAHRVLVARARAGADEFELSDCLFRPTDDPEQCGRSPSNIRQTKRRAVH